MSTLIHDPSEAGTTVVRRSSPFGRKRRERGRSGRRGFLVHALGALGAFVVAASLLGRFYAYDRLILVPPDVDTTVVAETPEGADATIFDTATLQERTTPLRQTVQVVGSPELSEQASSDLGRDTVAWYQLTCTDVPTFECPQLRPADEGSAEEAAPDELPMSLTLDLIAYDRRTADQVAWDGSFHEVDGARTPLAAPPEGGITIKFPFGTQKRSYDVWDGTARRLTPATFVGTTERAGLELYRFELRVPPTPTGTIDVPGSLVGSSQPTVTGDLMYSTSNVYEVEPYTGVIVNQRVSQDSYLAVDGERKLTTTRGTFVYTDAAVAETVETWKSLRLALRLVHDVLPVWGTGVGVLMILASALLQLWRRRSARVAAAD